MRNILTAILHAALFLGSTLWSDNQTAILSPVLSGSDLPFDITIEQANFTLPQGLQSYVEASYNNRWLMLSGRTNGLHGFDAADNFPPSQQNTTVFVLDPARGTVASKSLHDPSSGLTQQQIDTLSVTAAQYIQVGNTLYIVGGYGFDTALKTFNTKNVLTAVDVPGLMNWVLSDRGEPASRFIRQACHPILRVTGGVLRFAGYHNPYLLVMGQNFIGPYTDGSNGIYTRQIRPFRILDDGCNLCVLPLPTSPPNPDFRRRDLNVVPILQRCNDSLQPGFVALSGVFTDSSGIWTVPVLIDALGNAIEPNPADAKTLKQGLNNYSCPSISLYSCRHGQNFILLPGGLTYQYLQDGQLATDEEIPFTNQVAVITVDGGGQFREYLLDATYPLIPATFVHPGNPLLFGASSHFLPASGTPLYPAGIVDFDDLPSEATLLGYIVGGIASTVPNTSTRAESIASPYVFTVTLHKHGGCSRS